MKNLVSLFLILIFCSCGNSDDKPKADVIPKNKLIELLKDLHIADGMANDFYVRRQFGDLDSAFLYNSVFQKHGYTRDDLEKSISHYSSSVEDMDKIYDEVYSQLSSQSEQAKDLFRSTSLSATRRVWKAQQNKYNVKGDSVSYIPAFDFTIDTTGKFVLHAELKMSVNDESINPRMTAYFYNPLNDNPDHRIYFDTVLINKSAAVRAHSIIKDNNDRALNRVRITIPGYDNEDSIFYKDFEIRNLRLSLIKD